MLKKSIILSLCVTLAALLSGCGEHIIVNGRSYRVLSEDEEAQMLTFARMTLINSADKPGLPENPLEIDPNKPMPPRPPVLSPAQKDFIMRTKPEIILSYSGDKAGRASYEWIINDEVMIKLNCEGKFLTESMRVNTRKINLKEIKKTGKETPAERLTLKEIEF